jgi:hypothetical protein
MVASPAGHLELAVNGVVVEPGVATKVPFEDSRHGGTCLTGRLLLDAGGVQATMEDCAVPRLKVDETRELNLSLIKLWWSNSPQGWATIVTPQAAGDAVLTRDDSGAAIWNRAGSYGLLGLNDVALPVRAGSFRYQIDIGNLKPFRFEVAEGQQLDANVGYDSYLSTTQIAFEDREGYPDATNQNGAAKVVVECSSIARQLTRPEGSGDVPLTVLDTVPVRGCSIWAGGFKQPLTVTTEAGGRYALRRLNVEDVTLDDETKIAGIYSVSRQENGTDVAGAYGNPTGTGIDVPPGLYKVTLRYEAMGKEQSQDIVADLR